MKTLKEINDKESFLKALDKDTFTIAKKRTGSRLLISNNGFYKSQASISNSNIYKNHDVAIKSYDLLTNDNYLKAYRFFGKKMDDVEPTIVTINEDGIFLDVGVTLLPGMKDNRPFYKGELPENVKFSMKEGMGNKVLIEYGVYDKPDIDGLIIRSENDNKVCFKIPNKPKSGQVVYPTEIYYLVMNDIIKSIDIEKIKSIPADLIDDKDIKTTVINGIFTRYIKNTKYQLDNIDFGIPDSMNVSPLARFDIMTEGIREVMKDNIKMYTIYILMLHFFRNPRNMNFNKFITDQLRDKYNKICSEISRINEEGIIAITMPSVYDL